MSAPPIPSRDSSSSATVSILVPAYNVGRWIGQCVETALAQTPPVLEIIVMDDGSTDDTLHQLSRFGNRIRIEHGAHRGGNAARNRLLELASGEWLQYLDADDFLLPGKIVMQIARAGQIPDLDLVYSPVIARDERDGSEQLLPLSEPGNLLLHFIEWAALNTNGFLWRRSSVLKAGGWKLDQPACQEHELLMRMIENGARSSLVNQPGAVYRFHGNSSVSRKKPLEVVKLQMDLLDRMEAHLIRKKARSRILRKALFTVRMQAARSAWQWDRAVAEGFATRAKSAGSWWVGSSAALPLSFQILHRLVGFGATERIAAKQRLISR